MPEQHREGLEARLQAVERDLQAVAVRLAAVERRAGIPIPAPPPFNPPPVHAQPRPPAAATQLVQIIWPKHHEPSAEKAPKEVDDLEYRIGLTGLLRGGAVVIVIAIIYLVGLAASRGYITPSVQFAGELALCTAFIGFGFVMRHEREEFGQLMIGIGSCGTYLSFAGGHLVKHLYSGEMLVVLFLALSFSNLGFATWRASRSFLAIGMIGGLTAAMLPMRHFKPVLDCELHFLILVPAALIIVKNRWRDMALVLWAASTAALIPALTNDSVWLVRIGALYLSSLVCAVTYAAVWSEAKRDPLCALPACMTAVAGVGALSFDGVEHGSLHVLLLAAGGILSAWLFRTKPVVRNTFLFGAVAVAVVLLPTGYRPLQAGFAYTICAALLAVVSVRLPSKATAILANVEFALGVCAYLTPWVAGKAPYGLASESGFLIALMAAAALCSWAWFKIGKGSPLTALAGGVTIFPLFLRLGYSILTTAPIDFLPSAAFLIPALIFSPLVLAIGQTSRWQVILGFGWVALTLALVAYGNLIETGYSNPGPDTVLILCLIGAALYAGIATRAETDGKAFDYLVGSTGAVIGLLMVRLSAVLLSETALKLDPSGSCAIGLLAVSLASSLMARCPTWRGFIPGGWVAWALGSCTVCLLEPGARFPAPTQLALLAVSIPCLLANVRTSAALTSDRVLLTAVSVISVWALFSRFAYVLLTLPGIGLKAAPAVTLPWILYAIALIAIGFAFRARYLRYWSFAVFGATLVKIFAYDLTDLDPGIRVVLLMLLGLGMVGAGFWYIHSQGGGPRNAKIRRSVK